MNIFGKVLVVVVFVLSAAFAVSQMVLFQHRTQWRGEYHQERDQRRRIQSQLDETADRLGRREDELDDLRSEKAAAISDLEDEKRSLRQTISSLRDDVSSKESQLSAALEAKSVLNRRIDDREDEISDLEDAKAELHGDLQERMAEIEDLEEEKRAHIQEISDLETEIAELEEAKGETIAKLEEREQLLGDLEARGVRVDIYEPLPKIEGEISRADNEFGIAILNRGADHGVEINFDFVAYRDGNFIARLYVMEVHDDYSVARVDKELTDLQERPLRPGDKITTEIF